VSIHNREQDVLHPAVPELVHHPEPELGALVLLEPETQDFLAPVGAHAGRDVHSLVTDQAFVADLDPERVEEHQRLGALPQADSSGRTCQAATSSSTASVTALIRSGETSMP
jgi:hypothetical protein